ncbi:hypothetical protein HanRHA438_Chr03g0123531 [Helianthus annuus]|nr:hypothetical protein HanRHA438_Chr03g0123531 [Helianthus annuus]
MLYGRSINTTIPSLYLHFPLSLPCSRPNQAPPPPSFSNIIHPFQGDIEE